jgi:uncharacterized XkdX family phage protein
MDWYGIIKEFYICGYWTIEQVQEAVLKGKITEEEFTLICG